MKLSQALVHPKLDWTHFSVCAEKLLAVRDKMAEVQSRVNVTKVSLSLVLL